MYKLKPINGTDLTEYTVQLLQKSDITTVFEFIKADLSKLTKIAHLSEMVLADLKRTVLQRYGPQRENLEQLYYSIRATSSNRIYHTGIAPLDNILMTAPFAAGCVWELCGRPGAGKTHVALSMALNFASAHCKDVLYIDTKCDFSGTHIRQMLRENAMDKVQCGRIMQRIKVERVFTAEALIAMLQQLESCYQAHSRISFVIIDSLPSLWLQFFNDNDKLRGRALLTKIANIIRKLATKHAVAFLIVNLSLVEANSSSDNVQSESGSETNDNEVDQDDNVASPRQTNNEPTVRPALGYYWRSVPHIRLSIEIPDELDDDYARRVIQVLKSCYSRTGDCCNVHITDAGVV